MKGERTNWCVIENPFHAAFVSSQSSEINRLLSALAPIEAAVIRLRFGLGDDNDLSTKEIAGRLGLTVERVNTLQKRALAKIRAQVRE